MTTAASSRSGSWSGICRSSESTGEGSGCQLALELVRSGDRQATGKALAYVGRGPAVNGFAPGKQGNPPLCLCVARSHAGQHEPRPERRSHGPCQRLQVIPHQCDLAPGGEPKVKRLKQVAERLRLASGGIVQEPKSVERAPLVLVLVCEGGKAQ